MILKTDVFTPSRFTGKGSITLRGVEIPFHTVSEDNVFYDDEGKPIASIFSYSYFRSDVEDVDSRPVLFVFNGGPGTSSMMLHVGLMGPKRIKYGEIDDDGLPLPPYESCDNPQCLLDIADIVMVDPVGTGFGRLLDESKKDMFWGSRLMLKRSSLLYRRGLPGTTAGRAPSTWWAKATAAHGLPLLPAWVL